jgi:hypothetical protein
MRTSALAAVIAATFLATAALAKLPPLSDEAKAKVAEAAAKAAWTDKVGAYQMCKVVDRVVAGYRAGPAARTASAPEQTPPCADPGPFASPVAAAGDKPLEASGAHSPAATATGPPSGKATSAELTGPRK